MIDLTNIAPGFRVGSLVAIGQTTPKLRKNKGKIKEVTTWLFRCDCGNEKASVLSDVRAGDVQTCGKCETFRVSQGIKTCAACKRCLPTSAFNKRSGKKIGIQSNCRECDAVNQAAIYWQDPETARVARRRYQSEFVARNGNPGLNYKTRFPLKRAAHNAINLQIKLGKLIRPSQCEACINGHRIEAHHDDYTKPLEVMWLCTRCHRARHSKLKAEGKDPAATAETGAT